MSKIKAAAVGLLALQLLVGQGLGSLPLAAGKASAAETGTPQEWRASGRPAYVQDEVLVKFKPAGAARMSAQGVKSGLSLTTVDTFEASGTEVVKIESGASVESVIATLQASGTVESAQPNYLYYASAIQDSDWGKQWGLHNTGQRISGQDGANDVDIDAPEAWELAGSLQEVKVAVLDTGIDINHPDLSGKIDPDGWDFYHNDSTVFDPSNVYNNELEDAHGTHVAGIIAAAANNIGIRGVAPNVKLLPLKILGGPEGSGTTADAIKAVQYAVDHGAQVINASFGGIAVAGDTALNSAIAASGLVFVAAAGNGDESGRGFDIDYTTFSPAGLPASNIVSVAAIDNRGQLATFSNYGERSVDVAAPGVNIYSTFPLYSNGSVQHTYAYASGTSMAAPFVSGIAAILIGQRQTGTAQTVSLLKRYGAAYPALTNKTATGAMVNLNDNVASDDHVSLENNSAGATGNFAIEFRLGVHGAWNAGDRITIRFPDEMVVPSSISASQFSINTLPDAAVSVSNAAVDGQLVSFTVQQSIPATSFVDIIFPQRAGFRNPAAAGTYLVQVTTATESTPTFVPMKIVPDAGNLRLGEATDTSALLYWSGLPGDGGVYSVQLSPDGGNSWFTATVNVPIGPGSAYTTVTGLNARTSYLFRLSGRLSNGGIAYSKELEVKTLAAAPPRLKMSGTATNTSASFQFAPCSGRCELLQSVEGTGTWATATLAAPIVASSAFATITGLQPGTNYQFKLAEYVGETILYSNIVSTGTSAASAIGSVTSFTYSNLMPDQVKLSWTMSGSGASRYDIYRSDDEGATWRLQTDAMDGEMRGLDPSTAYRFRLVASNGEYAAQSAEDLAVTTPPLVLPATAGQLKYVAVPDNTHVELVFDTPLGASAANTVANYVASTSYLMQPLLIVQAQIDPGNAAKVRLTTSPMTAGGLYTIAGAVKDTANRSVSFTNAFAGKGVAAPPVLQSAAVNGSTLTLGFDRTLLAIAPDAADFTVKVAGGAGVQPLSAAVAGHYVKLVLPQPVADGQTVHLSYSGRMNPIRDASGQQADNLAAVSLRDVAARPLLLNLVNASVNTVELVFSAPMDRNAAEQPSQYEFVSDTGERIDSAPAITRAVLQPDPRRVKLTIADPTPGAVYRIRAASVVDTGGRTPLPGNNTGTFVGLSAQRITYSDHTFAEAASNDGGLTGTIMASLSLGLAFVGADQENYIATGKATLRNVPEGLVPVVKRTGANTVQLSFTGRAVSHRASASTGDVQLDFAESAFAEGQLASIEGARQVTFALSFRDPGTLSYSGTVFNESSANNGTIANTIGIALANAEFAGSNGEDFVATGKAAVYHLPNGLTPVVRRNGPQSLTVQLNGAAAAHANANDVANVELYLRDGAFAAGNARQYAAASRGDLRLDFVDAPATPIPTSTPGGGGSGTGGTGGTGGGGGGGNPGGGGGGGAIPFIPGIPGVGGSSPAASPTPTSTPKPTPSPTPSATPTPASSPKPLLPQSQLPNATTLPEQALGVSKSTDSRGQTTVTVTADGDELLRLLGGSGGSAGSAVIIPVDGSADHAKVQLPGGAIGTAAEQAPDAVVAVQSGSVSFELPMKLFVAGSEASSLLGGSGSTVTVSMEKVSGTTGQQLSASASSNGLTLLGDAFNFAVAVESGGTTTEVTDFGGTYVTRTMAFATDAATGSLTAVVYDPATGQFAFVPATIEMANGVAVVRISSPHNSIYSVASVARSFADLSGHWAKADIELLASKLVVQGVTDTSFNPDASITRAEFASLLVRALGIAAGAGPATPTFADARPGDWYYAAVEAAARAGLVQGDDGGRFVPQATIKREEMAAMLVRALRYAGGSLYAGDAAKRLAAFKDAASISDWARDAVAQAVDAGLVSGMSDATFAPAQEASRAQAAVMLKRLLQTLHFIN
ncbi:S8 family serine peptidase [Paenibacillus cymbidii]|uniref:S8 family serine peptidase n=1 Tax=Paenibacillus cymbidii TaxID=1639034 RepID=UPI0014368F2A|nr:S8 family serine peptidase [Paenibacillus cymbidii]